MPLIAVNCPSCGAPLTTDEGTESFSCPYCGTEFIPEKQRIELSGQVSVSGLADVGSLIDRAFIFLGDGDFENADRYLERVLDASPRTSKAYIGKLLCRLKFTSIEMLEGSSVTLADYDEFDKAMRFASPKELEFYRKLSETVSKRREDAKSAAIAAFYDCKAEKKREINDIGARIISGSGYLTANSKKYMKSVAKKALWKALLVVSICLTAFNTIGTIVMLPYLIFLIPSIVFMGFMIVKDRRLRSLTQAHDSAKKQLSADKALLNEKQTQLSKWAAGASELIERKYGVSVDTESGDAAPPQHARTAQ